MTRRGLLRALVRHHERQRWLAEVVRTRLRGNLGSIGKLGGFAHPEDSDDKRVPGLPEWSFSFHGIGCCLTHDDGTSIDVDFVDGTAEWIDPFFFNVYLASLPAPEPIEAALIQPEPLDIHWMADLPALRDGGFLELKHTFRVTDAGRAEAARTDDDPEPNPATRAAHLVEGLASRSTANCCLAALAVLGRSWAEPHVLARLAHSPIDGSVSRALEIADHWADPAHVPVVMGLLDRAQGEEVPAPWLRVAGSRFVMARLGPGGLTPALRAVLLRLLTVPAGLHDGEGLFLATLLDADLGFPLLVRCLNAPPSLEAACALAVMGTPEAIDALRGCHTIEAQKVLALFRGHPPERPEGVLSFEEFAQTDGYIEVKLRGFEADYGDLARLWRAS